MIHDSVAPDDISYNTVIHCMTRSANPEEAEYLLEDMTGAGVHPTNITYNTLLAAYFTLFSSATGRSTTKGTKTALAARDDIYIRKAEELFERMRNDPNVEPDVVTYNTMLHFYSRTGDYTKAESFLADMLKEDAPVRPDSTSMNTVIKAWANSGRPDAPHRSEDILFKMLDLSSKEGKLSYLYPTSITFNSVMSAWTKSRTSEAAERCQRLFHLMNSLVEQGQVNVKPDFVTFNTLIHAWSLAEDEYAPDRAEAVFQDMKCLYDAGNTRMRPSTRTYGSLINVWSKCERPNAGEKAEEYLRMMLQYSKPGRHSARVPFRRNDVEAPRVFEFTAAIRAWANSGDPRAPYKADEIFNLLLREIRQGNELARPDSFLFSAILKTLAQSKVPNKAACTDRIINFMKEYKIPPNRLLLELVIKCYDNETMKTKLGCFRNQTWKR
jgi:pentatricopeptide repeat protein